MAIDSKQLPGIMDYIRWRGDLPVASIPWSPVDSLLVSQVCHLDLPGCKDLNGKRLSEIIDRIPLKRDAQLEKDRLVMTQAMAKTRRFGNMRFCLQTDDSDADRSIQFSAVTGLVEGGPAVIAFRGTDHTLVGWKEDFMMSYQTPVPAQAAALSYLNMAASAIPDRPLVLTGHSKGGNLASYAGAHAEASVQDRFIEVCSFDGPGLDDATIDSQGYNRIHPVLRSFIPNASIIGLLMNYHKNYEIILSSGVGILQHNPFTWGILGPDFITAEDTTVSSQLIDVTVHEWLKNCSPEMQQAFVETLFNGLEKLYANHGEEDLNEVQLSGIVDVATYIQQLNPDIRDNLTLMLSRLVNTAKDTVVDTVLQKGLSNIQPVLNDLYQRFRSFSSNPLIDGDKKT